MRKQLVQLNELNLSNKIQSNKRAFESGLASADFFLLRLHFGGQGLCPAQEAYAVPLPPANGGDATCPTGRDHVSGRGRAVSPRPPARGPCKWLNSRFASRAARRLELSKWERKQKLPDVKGEARPAISRVSVCAARTLNPTGQSRVTLSLR